MAFVETLQKVEGENAEYAEQKKQERENVNLIAENGIQLITSDPISYSAYLDLQAANPRISPTNLGIVMVEQPELTESAKDAVFKQYDTWKKLGRNVNPGEKGIKVFLAEKYQDDHGITRNGYKIGRLFNISQTSGKPLPEKPTLLPNTPQMNKAFETLIRSAPVRIVENNNISGAALYSPESKTLFVNGEKGDLEVFRELLRETAHASFHIAGTESYDREGCSLDAESFSYMVCKRLGVPCEKPDIARVIDLYDGATVDERRAVLDYLKDSADKTGYGIEKNAFPELHQKKQKNKAPRDNGAR